MEYVIRLEAIDLRTQGVISIDLVSVRGMSIAVAAAPVLGAWTRRGLVPCLCTRAGEKAIGSTIAAGGGGAVFEAAALADGDKLLLRVSGEPEEATIGLAITLRD